MAKVYRPKTNFNLPLGIFLAIVLSIVIIIMSTSFWTSKACASIDTVEKALIYQIIQAQKEIHRNRGKFVSSLSELESYMPGFHEHLKVGSKPIPLEKWDIRISSDLTMVDIFILARENQYGKYALHSEIARIKYNSNNKKYMKLICRSTNPGTLSPSNISLDSAEGSKCPLDTREDC